MLKSKEVDFQDKVFSINLVYLSVLYSRKRLFKLNSILKKLSR